MQQTAAKKSFSSILLITLFDEISITIGFPLLTFLCFDRHTRLFAVTASHALRSYWYGALSAAPHFVMIGSILLFGVLSDRFGRKKILIVGVFGALFLALSSIISIILSSLIVLLIGMLFGGACARTGAVSLAAVNDISSQKSKLTNIGYLQTATALGAFIGPLVGGFFAKRYFFAQLNFSLPFIIAVLMTMIAIYLAMFRFQETYISNLQEMDGNFFTAVFGGMRNLFRREMLKISLILIFVQFSWRLYYQFMPPLLKLRFNFSPMMIGLFLSVVALFLCLATTFVLPRLNHIFSTKQILRFAIISVAIGLLISVVGCELPSGVWAQTVLWCSALPVAMGDVIVFCAISTLYSETMKQTEQGSVMGLNMTLVSVVWAVVGLCGGVLMGVNVTLPIMVAMVTAIAAVMLV